MANYNIKQIAYSGKNQCLTSYIENADGVIHPKNVVLNANDNKPGDWGDQYAPYQQIILNGGTSNVDEMKVFTSGKSYYLEIEIPKDDNYPLDFALLLIPKPSASDGGSDLDQLNYQFIRYLRVLQGVNGELGQSRVILYQTKDQNTETYIGDIQVGIVIDVPEVDGVPIDNDGHPYRYEAGKIYYRASLDKYMWATETTTEWDTHSQERYGFTDVILSHSWKTHTSDSELARYELVFTPRVDNMYALYLYLIPTKADNDIQWLNQETGVTFYGRHIDISKMKARLYIVNNLLSDGGGSSITARRIGVWGRSELILSINGEEVKIGPSNYYELRDFAVTSLGVAAQYDADRFTIDIQY